MSDLVRLDFEPTGFHPERQWSWEEWEHYGVVLGKMEKALQWVVGDWYLAGESWFGERAAQAIDGLALHTVQNAAWVAARFPVSRRRETLSFGHHAEVAAFEPEDADALLDKAESEGWSTRRLRLVRKEVKALTNGQKTSLPSCPECGEPLCCPKCGVQPS